jgi:hypothetical protein
MVAAICRHYGQVAEWLMAADCKSAAPCGLRRFESSPVHKVVGAISAHVAQLAERVLGKDEVTSSILVVGSIHRGWEQRLSELSLNERE